MEKMRTWPHYRVDRLGISPQCRFHNFTHGQAWQIVGVDFQTDRFVPLLQKILREIPRVSPLGHPALACYAHLATLPISGSSLHPGEPILDWSRLLGAYLRLCLRFVGFCQATTILGYPCEWPTDSGASSDCTIQIRPVNLCIIRQTDLASRSWPQLHKKKIIPIIL